MFKKNKNKSNTIIAADVLSTNALSGLSCQRNIWTGKAVAASIGLLGISTINATIPIINNGAVSPIALAIPIIVPVKIPGIARGSVKLKIVWILLDPRPIDASSIDGGTDLIAEREAITIVGRVIKPSVKPPTREADRGKSKKFRNIAKPSKPKTMEGTAARLLILVSIRSENLFLDASFSRYTAVSIPSGKEVIKAINIA